MFFGEMPVGWELDLVSSSSSMMKMPKKTAVDVDVVEAHPDWQMKKKVQMMFDEVVKATKMTRA
jgi:hypothetical protein